MNTSKALRVAIATMFSLGAAYAQQGRNYGRSIVITQQGIAATSQVLASQAGAQILAGGGSAVDAAIASNAVLGLTEPLMTGMGGDLFVIYWDAKTGSLTGLNASGAAPKALSPEFLAGKGIKRMPGDGIHSVTVPGAVEGWYHMHQRFGKLPWKDLFTAAISYAEQGFAVHEGIQEIWAGSNVVRGLQANDESARVFLPGKRAPQTGDLFKNPDLGHAYRLLAEKGPDAFYKGDIAAAILKTSQKLGGHHDGPRSGSTLFRMGAAHLDRLPRLEGLRTSSQQPRHGRFGDAKHHADHAAFAVRCPRRA